MYDNLSLNARIQRGIISIVCKELSVTYNQFVGHRRKRAYVLSRQYVSYFIKEICYPSVKLKYCNTKIGKITDRDRATVYHDIKEISNLIRFNIEEKKRFIKLSAKINEYVDNEKTKTLINIIKDFLSTNYRLHINLFITSFSQVLFVTANVYFISHVYWLGIIVCSFMISFLWAKNVKRISLGNTVNQIIYSIGASLGGLTGVIISKIIL